MRMKVTVLTLCVCACVCPPFSGSIKRLYNTLIAAIGFMLNAKDFQFTDLSGKASFESYSIFIFVRVLQYDNHSTLLIC